MRFHPHYDRLFDDMRIPYEGIPKQHVIPLANHAVVFCISMIIYQCIRRGMASPTGAIIPALMHRIPSELRS